MDIEKIRRTLEDTSVDEFNKVVDTIVNAKHIYILGVRSSASLASFISFYFYNIFENVRNIATSSTTAMPVASDHCHALPAIFIIAQTAMSGALTTT